MALAGCAGGATAALGTPPAKVAVPAQCSPRVPIELPVNSWAPARRELAPAGASGIRLCRYSGLSAAPKRELVRSVLVSDASRLRSLITEFDALAKPSPGPAMCPIDTGAEIVALLAYPGGHGVLITVGLAGCTTVDNGTVIRTAAGTQAGHELLVALEKLTGYTGPAFAGLVHARIPNHATASVSG
jgi:hypothetical protein